MGKVNRFGQAELLDEKQQDRLLEATPEASYRALWAIMRWTGSRVSETLSLTWNAYDGQRLTFIATTTKTKTTRAVLVAPRLKAIIEAYRDEVASRTGELPRPGSLMFPGRNPMESLTRQAADLRLRAVVRTAGLPQGISLHSFRRSLATTMVQRGASLPTVQKFTGHKSLEQLRRYVDVSEADELAALALLG